MIITRILKSTRIEFILSGSQYHYFLVLETLQLEFTPPYSFICLFHLMLLSGCGLYFESHPDYRQLSTSTSTLGVLKADLSYFIFNI